MRIRCDRDMLEKFGIATRFYGLAEGDIERLSAWIEGALSVVAPECVYIAIRAEEDKSGAAEFLRKNYQKINAFPVIPWGRVVQAPNALLLKAAERGEEHLLFASTEYPVTKSLVSRLCSHVDADTLIVGARLPQHDFKAEPGERVLVEQANGLQIPWNTCGLWSIEHLIHTGFVLTADSAHDPDNAGMEEMGTIAAQQILWPGRATAKLVAPREGDIVKNIYGWNVQRYERYVHHLESKRARSAAQLERLSLPTPDVQHIGVSL